MLKAKPTIADVHEALAKIVENADSMALVYAVNYASYGLTITDPEELRVQCLYVLNNMTHWRGETAKLVRTTLKRFCSLA